jgi:hypothetical protein
MSDLGRRSVWAAAPAEPFVVLLINDDRLPQAAYHFVAPRGVMRASSLIGSYDVLAFWRKAVSMA